jgi:hypothetical protein
VQRNVLRQHRIIVYRLKRQFGLPVVLYAPGVTDQNIETGKITRTWDTVNIRRAIVVRSSEARKFVYDLAYIAVAKNFTTGGYFDETTRLVIVDAKDLPKTFVPDLNMHFEFQDKRWEINKIERVEDRAGFAFTVTETKGSGTVSS